MNIKKTCSGGLAAIILAGCAIESITISNRESPEKPVLLTSEESRDINNDGRADRITCYNYKEGSCEVYVSLRKADGTYAQPARVFSKDYLPKASIYIQDWNHDGKLDILVIGKDVKSFVLYGKGDGTFQKPTEKSRMIH